VAIKTKRVYLIALTYLSRFLDNKYSFDVMTSEDLSNYINSMQKPIEEDPDQSWIGTQRMFGLSIQKFFKWLVSLSRQDNTGICLDDSRGA
jgi:hypothetical protein